MIVNGLSYPDLKAAREVASWALGNELVFSKIEAYGEDLYRIRLRVRDIDGPGARWHGSAYHLGYANWPRRSWFACSHAYGFLYVAIYERNPRAKITTAQIHYRDAWDFLNQYQTALDQNVGSRTLPLRGGDECVCYSDDIVTDTLRPSLWERGFAELPNERNTELLGF